MNKKETLEQAMTAREEEIMGYQINIDNYALAIPLAEADPDLADFAENLKSLLASSIIEQKKAFIIRDVIKAQLESIQ